MLRYFVFIVCALATVIGFAGIPEDIRQWADWLDKMDIESTRWVAVAVAVICGSLWVWLIVVEYGHKIPGVRRFIKFSSTIGAQPARQSSTPPILTTWISRADALATLGRSSLVRLRVPSDTTLLDVLARRMGDTYRTPGETRADELQRKLLRDFEAQYPNCVRDDQYGKEPLEWWIDERADQTNP